MLAKLVALSSRMQKEFKDIPQITRDKKELLECIRKLKTELGYNGGIMKQTIDEDDVNVLKTTIAMYKALCASIADECEKCLGRKMDSEGLYKYVCDALEASRNY